MSPRAGLVEAALLFLVLFLPGYLAGGASVPEPSSAMVQSIAFGLPQALLIVHLLWRSPVSSRPGGLARPTRRDAVAAGIVLAGALALAGVFIAGQAFVPAVRALGAGGYRWSLRSAEQLPLALAFALVAGYREELDFRAYLLGRLEDAGVPPAAGVAASTGLFALGHFYEGILGVAFAAVLGLYFAAAFLRTRSLHACAVAHGVLNTALLVLGMLAPGLPGAG
jgi:membrane protease YdiL (CAAX protease family)